jgi:hypothetical protein
MNQLRIAYFTNFSNCWLKHCKLIRASLIQYILVQLAQLPKLQSQKTVRKTI